MQHKIGIKIALLVAILTGFSAKIAFAETRHLEAHEHGVSSLKIAQEDKLIQFELEAPGDDIVGFEHVPKNAKEKKAVQEALAKLQKPASIFIPSPAADCEASHIHAEFETEDEHAGFHVTWELTCADISKVSPIQVRYFEMFKNAHEIDVEAIGDAGQVAMEVDHDQTEIDLSPAIVR